MVDLSLHLMDIMQNSVVVDSTYVEVRICAEKKKNLLTISVKDDEVRIESEPGAGTTTTATFQIDNIDRKPLGDVADTMTVSIMGHPELEFHLILKNDESEFVFRTEDVRAQIGEVPINDVEIISFIRNMLNEQITLLFGGILNEIIS